MAVFLKGDILERMKQLQDNSIDFLYFNPPFGTTRQPWDAKLPWEKIFAECFRVLKDTGNLAIHCSVPFNYELIRAAPRRPSYTWYWNKLHTTTFLNANKEPLRCVEEILVWKGCYTSLYNPQRVGDEERVISGKRTSNKYVDEKYLYDIPEKVVKGKLQTHYIEMKRTIRGFATRPDAMIELFLKTYTNEGDVVLDPTCYKGLSGLIARRMNRQWIGIDLNFEPEGFEYDTELPEAEGAAAGGGQ